MRRHIFFRDGGKCACCPTTFISVHAAWEADHIKPLVSANGDPSFWEPENLRLLCVPCHVIKTKGDNAMFRRKPRKRRRARRFNEEE